VYSVDPNDVQSVTAGQPSAIFVASMC